MNVIVVNIMNKNKVEELFGVFFSKTSFKDEYKKYGYYIDELSGLIVNKDEKWLSYNNVIVK